MARYNDPEYWERRKQAEQGLKRCRICHVLKPLSGFTLSGRDDRYLGGVKNECKECMVLLRRRKHLRRTYGLTVEQYDELLVSQGGVCGICKRPETSKGGRTGKTLLPLVVDHDHNTGLVRGLLCSSCNRAIGGFEDSTEHMVAAVEYLQRFIP